MFELPTPVFAKPESSAGKEVLRIWNDGSNRGTQIDSPIQPFSYDVNHKTLKAATKSHKKLMIPLSTRKSTPVTIHEFASIADQKGSYDYGCFNPTPNFVDCIVETNPDFFLAHPTKKLKVFTFDIEQYTEGYSFPEKKDPIISIAWSFNDDEPVCFKIGNLKEEGKLITAFAKAFHDYDPDVIVGYNHSSFDIPVMMVKFEQYGIPNTIWGRNNQEPFFYDKKIGPRDCKCIAVTGRVIYDVYHSVLTDQVLHGVAKGLKPVSRFYAEAIGLDPEDIIEEDMSRGTAHLVGTDELAKYNISDIVITRALFKKYFEDNLAIARFTGAPLNRLVPLPSTYAGTRKVAHLFHERGFLADSMNKDRYEWSFQEDGKTYEGATVQCLKTGLYRKVHEYDVNSLYPSIMAAVGMGPDNTRIVGIYPGVTELHCVVEDDIRKYYVPDHSRGHSWIVEVRGVSPIAQVIKDFLEERFILKRRAKVENDMALFSRAYALKVTANSFYGLFGAKFSPYGELGVAVLTTAIGREVLKHGMKYAKDKMGDNLIADTDGFKTTVNIPIAEMNAHTTELCAELHIEPIITWDVEVFEAIYIRQMKTYLTLQHGEFKKHGAAYKGSNLPKVFSKTIDKVGPILLVNGDAKARKIALECYNLDQYDHEDFIMNTRLSKAVHEYANPNALQPSIARMAEARGLPIYKGQSIDFIKTTYGYDLPSEESFKKIDREYYKSVINDAFDRMGISNPNQSSLEGWF